MVLGAGQIPGSANNLRLVEFSREKEFVLIQPFSLRLEGSPGEIRTPVGRCLLPLRADPEPTRDDSYFWPNVRAMLDHYTTGLRDAIAPATG